MIRFAVVVCAVMAALALAPRSHSQPGCGDWSRLSEIVPGTSGWLVYDTVRGEPLWLTGVNTERVFAWDGQSWRSRTAPGPSARFRFAVGFDESRGELVLYGGITAANEPRYDTWVWNGSAWRQTDAFGAGGGGPDGSMAFDPVSGRLLLFGGTIPGTYAWAGDRWDRVSTTTPYSLVSMRAAFSPEAGRLIAMSPTIEQAYEWTGSAWTSSSVPYRSHIVHDRNRNLLFGYGSQGSGNVRGPGLMQGGTWVESVPGTKLLPYGVIFDTARAEVFATGIDSESRLVGT